MITTPTQTSPVLPGMWNAITRAISSWSATRSAETTAMSATIRTAPPGMAAGAVLFNTTPMRSSSLLLTHSVSWSRAHSLCSAPLAWKSVTILKPSDWGDSLSIAAVELRYLLDSKGFYQPVYVFSGTWQAPDKRSNPLELMVPALNRLDPTEAI